MLASFEGFSVFLLFFHRTAEGLKLKGISGSNLVPPPRSSRVSQSRLPRAMSSLVLNISMNSYSTISLGNLFQCLSTLIAKRCLFVFRGNFMCFNLCPLPLVLSLALLRSLTPSSSFCTTVYTQAQYPPEPSLLQAEHSQLLQLLLCRKMPHSLNHPCGSVLGSLH